MKYLKVLKSFLRLLILIKTSGETTEGNESVIMKMEECNQKMFDFKNKRPYLELKKNLTRQTVQSVNDTLKRLCYHGLTKIYKNSVINSPTCFPEGYIANSLSCW